MTKTRKIWVRKGAKPGLKRTGRTGIRRNRYRNGKISAVGKIIKNNKNEVTCIYRAPKGKEMPDQFITKMYYDFHGYLPANCTGGAGAVGWFGLKINNIQNPMSTAGGFTGALNFNSAAGPPGMAGVAYPGYNVTTDQPAGLTFFQACYGRHYVKHCKIHIDFESGVMSDAYLSACAPVTINTNGVVAAPFNTAGYYNSMKLIMEQPQAKYTQIQSTIDRNRLTFRSTNQEIFGLKASDEELILANNYSSVSGGNPNLPAELQVMFQSNDGFAANTSPIGVTIHFVWDVIWYQRGGSPN